MGIIYSAKEKEYENLRNNYFLKFREPFCFYPSNLKKQENKPNG